MGILDIGFQEIILVLVVAVIVIGPQRLPGMARKIGRVYRNFKRITGDLTKEFKEAIDVEEEVEEMKKAVDEVKGTLDTEAQEMKKTAAEAKGTLDTEAQEMKKTLDAEARGMRKTAEEVKGTLDAEAKPGRTIRLGLTAGKGPGNRLALEVKKRLDTEAKEVKKTAAEITESLDTEARKDKAKEPKLAKAVDTKDKDTDLT